MDSVPNEILSIILQLVTARVKPRHITLSQNEPRPVFWTVTLVMPVQKRWMIIASRVCYSPLILFSIYMIFKDELLTQKLLCDPKLFSLSNNLNEYEYDLKRKELHLSQNTPLSYPRNNAHSCEDKFGECLNPSCRHKSKRDQNVGATNSINPYSSSASIEVLKLSTSPPLLTVYEDHMLLTACTRRNWMVFKKLIEMNYLLVRNSNYYDLVMRAYQVDCYQIMGMLLSHDMHLNLNLLPCCVRRHKRATDSICMTSLNIPFDCKGHCMNMLSRVCKLGLYDMAEIVIQHSDPYTDFDEPFLWACRKGHAKIVKMLLTDKRRIARPSIKSLAFAMAEASANGRLEIVKLLLKEKMDDGNRVSIHEAMTKSILHGHVDILHEFNFIPIDLRIHRALVVERRVQNPAGIWQGPSS